MPPTSWAIQIGIAQGRGFAHGGGGESGPLNTPYSAVPPVNMLEGPFLRPWTSSPPGMTPLQSKCSPHSFSAPSLPTLRASPLLRP